MNELEDLDVFPFMTLTRSIYTDVFCEKSVLKKFRKIHRQNSQPSACNFIKKDSLVQIHSYMTRTFSKNIHISFNFHIVAMENIVQSFCRNSDA